MSRTGLSIFAAIAAACLIVACSEREPVRIGFIGGVSGRFADLGTTGRNGVMLAIEEQNARGGIDGRRIELLVKDDEQDPGKAAQALSELAEAKVVAVLGPMTSSIAVAIAPQADRLGLLLVGGTVTTSALSGKDDNFIRTISTAAEYGSHAARAYRQRPGLKRAALLYDLANRDYTENWADAFAGTFAATGGVVVVRHGFDSRKEKDYGQLADRALRGKPDLVAIAANSVDGALLAQKIRQRNAAVQLAGSAWTGTQRLMELGGAAVEGMLIEQYYDQDNTSARYIRFRDAYQKRFGFEPGFAGVVAYDAAELLIAALPGGGDAATLKRRILGNSPLHGVQGDIPIDRFGDAERPITMTEVHGGRIVVAR